jgi:hypothetical protein
MMCIKHLNYINILKNLEHLLPRYGFIPDKEFIEMIRKIKGIEIIGDIYLGASYGIVSVKIKNPSGKIITVEKWYGRHIIIIEENHTYQCINGKRSNPEIITNNIL